MSDRDEKVTALQEQMTAMTAQLHAISHELELKGVRHSKWKQNITFEICSCTTANSKEKCLNLCYKCGYWESEDRLAEGKHWRKRLWNGNIMVLESKAEDERDWKTEHQWCHEVAQQSEIKNTSIRKKERKLT
ncbi:hypothetical protein PsorP6_004066 [Peronosclerospora sorghi]|uniref:Uncharacterized protein n=1 Tax=Peronosclerospora sorghi TaxID=230839 RepID=A0ACC0VQJ2_9STRA|nr:hypothetical protein PsorP6_004066 [Peronosclerospora sorghi]